MSKHNQNKGNANTPLQSTPTAPAMVILYKGAQSISVPASAAAPLIDDGWDRNKPIVLGTPIVFDSESRIAEPIMFSENGKAVRIAYASCALSTPIELIVPAPTTDDVDATITVTVPITIVRGLSGYLYARAKDLDPRIRPVPYVKPVKK